MNANAVLAAVGTGPPGQPPPDTSTVTPDGQPFAAVMAQALEGQPGIEGVTTPSLISAAQGSTVPAGATGELALLANMEGLDATSVGLDRLAEVTEDKPSPEETTESLLTVIPALVPWTPPAPVVLVERGSEMLVTPVSPGLGSESAAVEGATPLLDGGSGVALAGSAPGIDAGPPSIAPGTETLAASVEAVPPAAPEAGVVERPMSVATRPVPDAGDTAAPGSTGATEDLSRTADVASLAIASEDTSHDSTSPRDPGQSSPLEPADLGATIGDAARASEGGAPSPTGAGLTTPVGPSGPAPAASSAGPAILDATEPVSVPPALADSVASAVRVGQDELRLVLNPPDLGQLDVRIVETGDGLRVSVHASTREASELIQQQLPALQTALEARDLRVDRLEVRAGLGGGLDQPGERGGQRGNPEPDQPPEWSSVASMERASDGPSSTRGVLHRPGGRLDLVA